VEPPPRYVRWWCQLSGASARLWIKNTYCEKSSVVFVPCVSQGDLDFVERIGNGKVQHR